MISLRRPSGKQSGKGMSKWTNDKLKAGFYVNDMKNEWASD